MSDLTKLELYYISKLFELKGGFFSNRTYTQYEIIKHLEGKRTGAVYEFFNKMVSLSCLEKIEEDKIKYSINRNKLIDVLKTSKWKDNVSCSQMIEKLNWELIK